MEQILRVSHNSLPFWICKQILLARKPWGCQSTLTTNNIFLALVQLGDLETFNVELIWKENWQFILKLV